MTVVRQKVFGLSLLENRLLNSKRFGEKRGKAWGIGPKQLSLSQQAPPGLNSKDHLDLFLSKKTYRVAHFHKKPQGQPMTHSSYRNLEQMHYLSKKESISKRNRFFLKTQFYPLSLLQNVDL